MIKRYEGNVSSSGTPATMLSSQCLHLVSELLLSCFYAASLWLRRFLWIGRRQEVFSSSSLCVWSQMPWRSRRTILLPQAFLYVHLLEFDNSQNLWCYGSITLKAILVLPKYFFQFWVQCSCVADYCRS